MSNRYIDDQMRRKYSLYRWAAGTIGAVLAIILIVVTVVIFTTYDEEHVEDATQVFIITTCVSGAILLLALIGSYIGIEFLRRREYYLRSESNGDELSSNSTDLHAEIARATRPTAPPSTIRASTNTRISSPPPYEATFRSASFWHNAAPNTQQSTNPTAVLHQR